MKTLQEYNEYIQLVIKEARENPRANVLCDKCGSELFYSDNLLLTSYPPKRNVHCRMCGFKGLKVEQ
jgi:ribosomal protein L40E